MAKKSDNDPKQNTLARIRRTEAYAERVRTLFAATVNEILALNKTMPTLPEGEMFSFDNESLKKQKEVERLLRQLHSVATMAIEKGIRLEWAQANAECDKLVQSCFGKRALETPEFTAWTQRNEAAMAAFISRSERGLNLSQRVWKSCRQLRDEMEVAITVAVGDGTSAASMSRSVRKYLNDPDLMFRRFRYKIGEEIEYDEDGNEIGKKIVWGKKWKKKIRKPDGTVGWIDYDKDNYRDEWTGPGYYKSSAQNAMRVARTETNIAYRRADNARWQQMDFVLGQRVSLSRSHPKTDICDKLAGDYPPDFVFDGWHPQCFCYVTPILIDEDEILKMNEAMLNGETYKPRGKRITQYPDNFKQWVRDNEERIIASHDTGTDPYFVRNNFGAVQDILNPKKQLTPLEIAEQRHANRTPEQEEKIRLAWQERKDRIEAEKRAAEAERLRIRAAIDKAKADYTQAIADANACIAKCGGVVDVAKLKALIAEKRTPARNAVIITKDIQNEIKEVERKWNELQNGKLDTILDNCKTQGIDYRDVVMHKEKLSADDVIKRISGGDTTVGSCSSMAFTFAANMGGMDVLDYRGGKSCDFFSSASNICSIAEKVGGVVNKNYNDFTNAKQLLATTSPNKYYYFTCGKHAAIVRKTEKGYEYLELQNASAERNGWHKLTTERLKNRFGAQKSHTMFGSKFETKECIIDIDLLIKDAGFRKMMGYINTASGDQKKGSHGGEK